MLFGDRRLLAFEIDSVHPSWKSHCPTSPTNPDPWAQLVIWAGGKNLTANQVPSGEVQKGIFVPLAPLADWLVRNAKYIAFEESAHPLPTDINLIQALEQWCETPPIAGYSKDTWDAERSAWRGRHFLPAGADGSWVPNLALVRSDETLWLSWSRLAFATPGAPVFLEGEDRSSSQVGVPWVNAMEAIEGFVDYTGRELRRLGLTEGYPWSLEEGSFQEACNINWEDFIESAIHMPAHRVANLLGATEVSEIPTRLGLNVNSSPLDSVAMLALRDLKGDEGLGEALRAMEQSTRKVLRSVAYFRARNLARYTAKAGDTPEAQGRQAASALRLFLGLGSGAFPAPEEFLPRRLGVRVDCSQTGSGDNFCAVGARLSGSAVIFLIRSACTEISWIRRMEILCGLGHLLLDAAMPGGSIGAGSSSRSCGPRWRRSEAFAAELLLPQEAVVKATGGVVDASAVEPVFRELMDRYDVGANTVFWQLHTAGLCHELAEKLIKPKEVVY